METAIIVSLIGATVSIVVGVITYYFNSRKDLNQKKLEFKLDRYKEFLSGFAELGSGYKSYEAHLKVANAINTINLIGSTDVLKNTYDLLDYISNHRDDTYSITEQNQIINKIILSIRKDLFQKYTGNIKDFQFRTISPGMQPGASIK